MKRKQLKGEYRVNNNDGVSHYSFYLSYSFSFSETIFYFSFFPAWLLLFALIELLSVLLILVFPRTPASVFSLSTFSLIIFVQIRTIHFYDDYQVDISPLHWGLGGQESLMIRCWIIHFLCFSRVVRVRLKSSSWRLLSWIPPKETVTCIMVSGREFFPCPPHFLLMLVWALGFASKEQFGRTMILLLPS